MKGITDIFYVRGGLGKSPAATNRKTGVVYINIPYWEKLPYEHRLFVMLHELGHIVHDTSDEFLADSFAFEQYAKLGYSLTESVYALSQVLSKTTPEQFERIETALHRALKYDAKENHNPKAEQALNDFFMYQGDLDGFNFKKTIKKALTKTPLKYTPVGLLASSNRKSLGNTVQKVATKTPLKYTPLGVVAAKATKPKKRVSATPTTAIAATANPLEPKIKVTADPISQPVLKASNPIAEEPHWSDENENMEEVDENEFEEVDENEAINDDVTDGFSLKKTAKKFGKAVGKVVKKTGDALAPVGDTVLKNVVPGGSLIVDARKNILANNKAKAAGAKTTETPAQTMATESTLPITTPAEQVVKDTNNQTMIIGIVCVVIALILLFLLLRKAK